LTTHDPWAISPKKWSWHLVTTKSIEIDHERSSWHAGRVHDLLVLGGSFGDTLLVGSAYSGVWIIRPADWSASCLSEDWDRPDVNCLATGSTTSIFAGCGSDGGLNGALYESVNGIYSPWYSIPLHPNIKTIFEIVVWEKAKIIVLACYGGIFWSAIPARGGTYDWKSADWNDAGLKTTEPPSCYSVTMGKDGDGRDVIFVGAFNTHSGNRGIFIGSLERIGGDDRPGTGSRILAIRRVSISTSGFDSINMHRVSLASCKSNRKVIYALSVDDKGKPNSVLKTVDGGRTWTLCKTTLKVKDGTKQITDSDYGNNEQGGIIHKISVSPSDSNVVAFGVLSPFVSYDGGQIWQRLDKWEGNLDTHEDIHKIIILGGETFYILSDGGIAYTNDKGSSIHSYCNKNLSNLLLYSTLTRGFLGRIFASYQFPNLVGGGLQDNSNSYLEPASWGTAWKKVRSHGGTLEGGDGGQMLSLRTGRFVADRTLNDRYPRVATWDPSKKIFQIGETIKVQDSDDLTKILANFLPWTAMEIVNNPKHFNKRNQKMYAVGACAEATTLPKVFGLFSQDDGSDMHWEPIIDSKWKFETDHLASSIGTSDGRDIFFATSNASLANRLKDLRIYRLTPSDGKVSSTAALPSVLPNGGLINRLIVQSNLKVFAAYGDPRANATHPYGESHVLRTLDSGKSWTTISGGLPGDGIYGMDDDWTTTPKTIYVSTDNKVYVSNDEGNSWKDFSAGLPSRPHCGDLRFVMDRDGSRHLFLGTYGQSLWHVNLSIPI
jgi:photosystem II stability/assembly factor-like uncharacterized protein